MVRQVSAGRFILSILDKDLKPSILLISYTGHLKITDFGLARVCSNDEGREYRELKYSVTSSNDNCQLYIR